MILLSEFHEWKCKSVGFAGDYASAVLCGDVLPIYNQSRTIDYFCVLRHFLSNIYSVQNKFFLDALEAFLHTVAALKTNTALHFGEKKLS